MYVPASELQQHKGQWMCPICISNARADDARMKEAKSPTYKKNDYPMQVHSYEETCERCGRTLVTVYFLNGKKLCEDCLHGEQDKWEIVSGDRPPMTPNVVPVEAQRKSALRKFFERLFSELLGLFGVKWRPKEPESEVVALPQKVKGRMRSFGKPMVSRRIKDSDNVVPVSEGIIRRKPKKTKKKSQDVSFPKYEKKGKKRPKKE